MVAGDFWAVEEAMELLGNIEGVSVKKGINMYTAECLNPAEARRRIRDGAKMAVLRRGEFEPYKVGSPVEIKIEYTNTNFADKAEMRHGAIRMDGRTALFKGDDFIKVFNQSFI
jgi:D-amino peptidase